MTPQQKLEYLARYGITTSIVYGPMRNGVVRFSVNVLTLALESFEKPFAAETYEQTIDIAMLECTKRGWLTGMVQCGKLSSGS